MRSKQNLKTFSHVTKTAQEKSVYGSLIEGTTKGNDDTKDSFDDTLSDEKPSGNPEPIKKDQAPYISTKTWFKEHWRGVIAIPVGLAVLGWGVTTFISYGNSIASLTTGYSNMKDDVSSLKTKYDSLNDTTIKSSVLLDEIQKDINSLNQRLMNTAPRQ